MIRLGIIGAAGSCFLERYLSLFGQLQGKVQIVAVYDSVLVHASQVASYFEAEVSCSFQRLVDRPDIHGLLMLSSVWPGELPVSAAMLRNKPLFCSHAVWKSFRQKKDLERLYQETGATVVVESECRYWPSILRARELQATQLGQPCELIWQLPTHSYCDDEAQKKKISSILDGLCFLLQRNHIQQENSNSPRFLFEKHSNDANDSIPVSIRLLQEGESTGFLLKMRCERGSIEINSATELNWQSGGESYQNLLKGEQSAMARQIDHFCRHVSGGLIPLHDITNALWNDRQTKWIQKHLVEYCSDKARE